VIYYVHHQLGGYHNDKDNQQQRNRKQSITRYPRPLHVEDNRRYHQDNRQERQQTRADGHKNTHQHERRSTQPFIQSKMGIRSEISIIH